jgi:hypothetical protein
VLAQQLRVRASQPEAALLLLLSRLLSAFVFVNWTARARRGFTEPFVSFSIDDGAHQHVHGQSLSRVPFVNSADGRNVAVIASISQPDMAQVHGLA